MAVERRDEVTEQLRRRIASGLHLGLLSPGDRLPTVRELAHELGANPRVVLAAYAQLQREALVEPRNRSGFYVPQPAALGDESRERQAEWMVECLTQAVEHGIPAPLLADRLRQALEARPRVVVADSNDDELWSITRELHRDYGVDAIPLDLDAAAGEAEVVDAIRTAGLVVTTPSHGAAIQALAGVAGVRAHVLAMRSDLYAGVRTLLERQAVYFVVCDPRFEARLRHVFANVPGAGRLQVLVHGRDHLDAIPPETPLYLTPLTRERMAGSPLLSRGLPEARVFSPESTRELMRLVVRTNLPAPSGASSAAPSHPDAATSLTGAAPDIAAAA